MGTKVFISYKSEYRDFARKVQQRLRDWGYETWFDMDDIPKGAYFRHAIQEGLDTSDVLVGVMTQEAFQSREVMAEWDYFLSQDKDVVPLKYRECKPLYHLVTIQWIDFTANERQGFAQLRDSLQRIIAAPEPAPEAEE
ncbi:MAG: toll/interleukin-1 receptor domain-containing protein, partial [Anaerolineae bacterium]|nr:toll/interleukin-1 receptor domain-containing protein [Anaerolineae bacterium]